MKKLSFLIVAITAILVFFGCSKDDNKPEDETNKLINTVWGCDLLEWKMDKTNASEEWKTWTNYGRGEYLIEFKKDIYLIGSSQAGMTAYDCYYSANKFVVTWSSGGQSDFAVEKHTSAELILLETASNDPKIFKYRCRKYVSN